MKMIYIIINGKHLSGRFELFSDDDNYYLAFDKESLVEVFKDLVIHEKVVTIFIDETDGNKKVNLINEVFEGSNIKFTEFIGLKDGYALKIEYVK